jgi:predicted DNA-binding transcriptional regulator YafY
MRRADRLFAIVQMLRGRRLTTARQMAERFHVSERTIYRDIQELARSVPIAGEAGVGYTLSKDYDIPPIMFDTDELEALVIGARMVGAWGSPSLSQAAERALEKIRGVVPAARRVQMEATQIYAPDFHISRRIGPAFELFRQAIRDRIVTHIDYQDESGRKSKRHIRPLALHFWGERWTVAAWCEKRRDFRLFRLDRIASIDATPRLFRDEAGKTYADFLRRVDGERAGRR